MQNDLRRYCNYAELRQIGCLSTEIKKLPIWLLKESSGFATMPRYFEKINFA